MTTWYRIRTNYDNFEPLEDYGEDPTHFSLQINHGGKFVRFPGRKYVKGAVNYVDLVDGDHFSVHELNEMIIKLGYTSKEKVFSHYKIPDSNLDVGLRALANDKDVIAMLKYVDKHKVIELYLEHKESNVDTYFKSPDGSRVLIEELDEPVEKATRPLAKCNKRLFIEWPVPDVPVDAVVQPDVQTEFEDVHVNADFDSEVLVQVQGEDQNVQHEQHGEVHAEVHGEVHGEDQHESYMFGSDVQSNIIDDFDPFFGIDDPIPNVQHEQHAEVEHNDPVQHEQHEDEIGSSDNSDSEDETYMVDEENLLQNIDVDMRTFFENIDLNEEWCTIDDHEQQVTKDADDEDGGIDVDDFESGTDSENDTQMRKKLRKLRREKKRHLAETSENQSTVFYVGQLFTSKEIVKEMVSVHALESRRQLHVLRNDKIRFRVICKGAIPDFVENASVENASGSKDKGVGGDKDDIIGRDRGILDSSLKSKVNTPPTCPWVLYLSKGKDDQSWTVKTYTNVHTCLPTRDVKQCTATFLSKEVQETIGTNPKIPIKGLQAQIQRKYEVHVSEMKIFRAKVMASKKIQGDYSYQYAILRDYALELIRSNEGSTVKIDLEPCCNPASESRVFRRIYICLGPLKRGFASGMRPILGLDGSFMKGPWPGQILTAVGIDGNNNIYPFAYAIVEAETRASWTWFLECLGDDLELDSRSNYTFISDRQKGILPALEKTFPSAEHRFCLRHISQNMKLKWKGDLYKDHLWRAATATTIPEFTERMEAFKQFDKGAYDWLAKIPPRHWARSHFSARSKCDVVLNNLCEVFNKQLVDGRDKPIITCLEYIREYIMRKIVNVQKVIDKSSGPLTPTATIVFNKIKSEAAKCKVAWNGSNKFQVSDHADQFVVDIKQKFCSCRKWELTGIPCKHAVASLWDMGANGQQVGFPEAWVDKYYWLDTWKQIYNHKIDPINGRKLWPKSPAPTTVIPPKHHTPIGRPKKKRRKSAVELAENVDQGGKMSRLGGSVTCSKCKKQGHNSRSCKGQEAGPSKSKVTRSSTTKSKVTEKGKVAGTSKSAGTGKGKGQQTKKSNVQQKGKAGAKGKGKISK